MELLNMQLKLFFFFSSVKDLDVVKLNAPDGMFEKYMGFISHFSSLAFASCESSK